MNLVPLLDLMPDLPAREPGEEPPLVRAERGLSYQIAEGTDITATPSISITQLYIGAQYNGAGGQLNALISELKLWNKRISP